MLDSSLLDHFVILWLNHWGLVKCLYTALPVLPLPQPSDPNVISPVGLTTVSDRLLFGYMTPLFTGDPQFFSVWPGLALLSYH